MTRSEAIKQITQIVIDNEEFPNSCAQLIMDFYDRKRMSTHQADEWEPEDAE